MSGHKGFKNLASKIEASPERRARADVRERMYRAAIRLAELRTARGATQSELAEAWEVSQANVSRVERQDDLYLSTLGSYVTALGGHVELTAVFEDETIDLTPLLTKESAESDVAQG